MNTTTYNFSKQQLYELVVFQLIIIGINKIN